MPVLQSGCGRAMVGATCLFTIIHVYRHAKVAHQLCDGMPLLSRTRRHAFCGILRRAVGRQHVVPVKDFLAEIHEDRSAVCVILGVVYRPFPISRFGAVLEIQHLCDTCRHAACQAPGCTA